MQIHYLEIVTPDVDATCGSLEKLHGVSFSAPESGLGNARTAPLGNGGLIGVRPPMHETEEPVVRPYVLVEDVEAATKAAKAAGGEIAHPPMEIPGHGKFAIYIQGRVAHVFRRGGLDDANARRLTGSSAPPPLKRWATPASR